jgi:hypothetical protein
VPDFGASWILAASIGGIVAGLVIVVRNLAGYRSGLLVADTSTSTISSAAAGELRVSGIIQPEELTLVSLLQSMPCVYYRSSIGRGGDGSIPDSSYSEERSIGFRVRDATGELRVFPRGARVDAPLRFHDETGPGDDEPPGLAISGGHDLRARRRDPGDGGSSGLLVGGADPGPGGHLGCHELGSPVAVCGRGAVSGSQVAGQRPGAPARDERLEAMIADRRELYNDQVYRYNTSIGQVPGVLLASLLGWKTRQFFAADPGEIARPDASLGPA